MVFQREYGKNIDLSMSESSVDKSIVPEYSELLDCDENSKSTAEAKTLNNNNNISSNNISINNNVSNIINNNNSSNSNITTANPTTASIENPVQIGDVEMTSVEISTQPAILPELPSAKAIDKQIETRRADGKRRITAMFVPFSAEQDRWASLLFALIPKTHVVSFYRIRCVYSHNNQLNSAFLFCVAFASNTKFRNSKHEMVECDLLGMRMMCTVCLLQKVKSHLCTEQSIEKRRQHFLLCMQQNASVFIFFFL